MKRGFTLIELLVVIAILAIGIAIVFGAVMRRPDNSPKIVDMQAVSGAYRMEWLGVEENKDHWRDLATADCYWTYVDDTHLPTLHSEACR